MIGKGQRFFLRILLLSVLFLLGGCNRGEGGTESGQSQEQVGESMPLGYVASFQEVPSDPDSAMGYFRSGLYGDTVYFVDNKGEGTAVYQREYGKAEAEVFWSPKGGEKEVVALAFSKDGGFLLLETTGGKQGKYVVEEYGADKEKVHSITVSGVAADTPLMGLAWATDGRIFVRASEGGMLKLKEIREDGNLQDVQAVQNAFLNGIGTSEVGAGILYYDTDALWYYDGREESREILKWKDVSILPRNVQAVRQTESDVRVLTTDLSGRNAELALIRERTASDPVGPKKLVLATLLASTDIRTAVSKFNRSNQEYNIQITEYLTMGANTSKQDIEDAVMRMGLDMLGEKAPDMLDVSGIINYGTSGAMTVEELLEKGYVLDLTPFAEKSDTVNLGDFEEKLLALCSHEGKVAAIPYMFELMTLIADKDVLGDRQGWTVAEFIEWDEKLKEPALLEGLDRWLLLELCLEPNLSDLVDEKAGKCHFDDENFRRIMERAAKLPDNKGDYQALYQKKGAVVQRNIQNLDSLPQFLFRAYGDRSVFIGLPSFDGSYQNVILPALNSSALAISSASKNQEGAWAFIEDYLGTPFFKEDEDRMAYDERRTGIYGMPANRKILREYMDYLMKEGGGMGRTYTEEQLAELEQFYPGEYLIQPIKPEEEKSFYDLLQSAKTITARDKLYMAIIEEEAGAYFAGQKSLEEVTAIIQNRIELYLAENIAE